MKNYLLLFYFFVIFVKMLIIQSIIFSSVLSWNSTKKKKEKRFVVRRYWGCESFSRAREINQGKERGHCILWLDLYLEATQRENNSNIWGYNSITSFHHIMWDMLDEISWTRNPFENVLCLKNILKQLIYQYIPISF